MTKPLRFSKAEITNAAKIVKEQGVAIELKPDGTMLLIPSALGALGVDDAAANQGSILQQWRSAKNAGKALGRPYR